MGVHCIGASAPPDFVNIFKNLHSDFFSDIGPKSVRSKQLILLLAPPYLEFQEKLLLRFTDL